MIQCLPSQVTTWCAVMVRPTRTYRLWRKLLDQLSISCGILELPTLETVQCLSHMISVPTEPIKSTSRLPTFLTAEPRISRLLQSRFRTSCQPVRQFCAGIGAPSTLGPVWNFIRSALTSRLAPRPTLSPSLASTPTRSSVQRYTHATASPAWDSGVRLTPTQSST